MTDGTATPTPAEWPALRAAWAHGTVAAADLAGRLDRAYVLLGRMAARGLMQRVGPGAYAATHSRATMASYVLGDESG